MCEPHFQLLFFLAPSKHISSFVLVGKNQNLEAMTLQSKQMFFPSSNKTALPVEMSLSLALQLLLNGLHQSFWLTGNEQTQTCSRQLSLPALTASVLSGSRAQDSAGLAMPSAVHPKPGCLEG